MATTQTPILTMYTTTWCGDCRRSKAFLDRHGVPYREVNVEDDDEAVALVARLNRGYQSVPTLVLPDGRVLTEPSNHELAAALGLGPAPASARA